MSFWQRLKNLWRLSNYEALDITEKIATSGIAFKGFPETKIKLVQPQRLAKIVQEPLPDNLEEDDNTNQ